MTDEELQAYDTYIKNMETDLGFLPENDTSRVGLLLRLARELLKEVIELSGSGVPAQEETPSTKMLVRLYEKVLVAVEDVVEEGAVRAWCAALDLGAGRRVRTRAGWTALSSKTRGTYRRIARAVLTPGEKQVNRLQSYLEAGFDLSTEKRGLYYVRCSQCRAAFIQSMYCHETGCPNEAKAKRAKKQKEEEDDA